MLPSWAFCHSWTFGKDNDIVRNLDVWPIDNKDEKTPDNSHEWVFLEGNPSTLVQASNDAVLLQPYERPWARITQLNCCQIPDPQKPWESKCQLF